jgi:hypothetical protein
MGFVEEEHGVGALFGEILDVSRDGVKDRGGGRRGRQSERDAELAIKVTPSEGGIVAIGQSEAGAREALSEGAEHARLADAGLANEEDGGALLKRLDERGNQFGLRRWEPELGVGNLLAEGLFGEAESSECGGCHDSP